MTPGHFWPWYSWSLLGLNIFAESAVLYCAIRRRMHFSFPFFVGFVAFSLLMDIGTVIGAFTFTVQAANGVFYVSEGYSRYWWATQIIASLLILAMSVQLIVVITSLWEHLIGVTAIVSLVGAAYMFYSMVAGWDVVWLRSALAIADVIAGLILLLLWIATFDLARQQKDWPEGTRLIAFGIAAYIGLQFGCAILSLAFKTMVGFITVGPAVASLAGMLLFLFAVSRGGCQRALQANAQCPAL